MFTLHILPLENITMEKREAASEVAVTPSRTEGVFVCVCVCVCVCVHACRGFVVHVLII